MDKRKKLTVPKYITIRQPLTMGMTGKKRVRGEKKK
jgi:hypothetical protein